MGVMNPGLVMRNIIPVVMAGVLGIYGLIVAVILQGSITKPDAGSGGATKFSSFSGYARGAARNQVFRLEFRGARRATAFIQLMVPRRASRDSPFNGEQNKLRYLSAGLCCGLSGLAAGMAIGVVGDAGVRAVGQQEKLFVGMILILIFAEALGLYGLIVALILSQQSADCQ